MLFFIHHQLIEGEQVQQQKMEYVYLHQLILQEKVMKDVMKFQVLQQKLHQEELQEDLLELQVFQFLKIHLQKKDGIDLLQVLLKL